MQRALLLLLVAGSYLLLAGARPWTLGPLLTVAVLAIAVAPKRTLNFPESGRWLDGALLALCVALVIQAVPMPLAIVHWLSPHGVRVQSALELGAFSPVDSWRTISIAPRLTWIALGTVALGILSFWIARAVFGAGGNTRAFCRTLTVLGATAALLALLQRTLTPRLALFTFTSESLVTANPFGAFVNRNHMAAWLLLMATPLGGYLIARLRIHPDYRSRFRASLKQFLVSGTALMALGVLVIVGVLMLTLSRSAIAGLGVAVLTAWRYGRSRVDIQRTAWPTALGAAGAVLVGGMLFINVDGWAARVQDSLNDSSELSRMQIWRESAPMVRDFWLTGTGAGTFSDAMIEYQQSRVWIGSMQRWAHFNNAHSHYLQVAVEGGLLLGLPVLVAIWSLASLAGRAIRADKGEMFWVRVGAVAGLAGLGAQSIWETSLIMPANAVLAGVLAGLALHRRDGSARDPLSTAELLTVRPVPARRV